MAKVRVIIACFVLLLPSMSAYAGLIRIDFSGKISGLGSIATGSNFSVGRSFYGWIEYDSEALDTIAVNPTKGRYPTAISEFAMTVAGVGPFRGAGLFEALVEDGDLGPPLVGGIDLVSFSSDSVTGPNLRRAPSTDLPPARMFFGFRDTTRTVLSNDLLPSDFSGFTGAPSASLNFGDGRTNVRFGVENLSVTAQVPVPPTLLLLALGCSVLLWRRSSIG